MRDIEVPTRKRNRYMSKLPKRGHYWCWKCDRNLVAEGARCDECGALNGHLRKHRKEFTPS